VGEVSEFLEDDGFLRSAISQPLLGPHPAEVASHGQRDPEDRAQSELKAGAFHWRIVPFCRPTETSRRHAEGMAKPFAKQRSLTGADFV
jgi:hypothetical protein